jgi:CelD/BcsL family acetyltransferase involved in cellulose biosynthesis
VQCSVVHPSELGDTELALWRRFVEQAGFRSPFLTPTYTTVIAAHRPESRVAILLDGSDIVGFLPYECSPERVGLPIGGGTNDVQALVTASDFECDLPDLVRRLRVREWRFDHLLPGQELFAPFHREIHRSPVIDLSDGYETYALAVRQNSASVLSQAARRRRQLAKEVGPVSTEWRSSRPEDIDLLISMKAAQYERTGAYNLFGAAWSRDAVRHFAELQEGECAGIMSALRAGDRTIALHFGLTSGSLLHWWFPVYDPLFAKYSPGLVLLLDLAAAAGEHGVDLIDLGMGEHDYKLRVANSGYEVAAGRVPARGRWYRAALLARHPAWLGRRIRGLAQDVRSATTRRPSA